MTPPTRANVSHTITKSMATRSSLTLPGDAKFWRWSYLTFHYDWPTKNQDIWLLKDGMQSTLHDLTHSRELAIPHPEYALLKRFSKVIGLGCHY